MQNCLLLLQNREFFGDKIDAFKKVYAFLMFRLRVFNPFIGGEIMTEERNKEQKKGTQNVTSKKIIGSGKNLYLVNWSRCANFGYNLMRADTEEEAYKNHLFSKNDEVNFIITKISEENLPVIFKGGSQ